MSSSIDKTRAASCSRVAPDNPGSVEVRGSRRPCVARAFGAVLRELRTVRGITKEQLAEMAHLHRTYPSLLERARRTPTLTVILRLSDALEVTPDYLINKTATRLGLDGEKATESPRDNTR